MAARRPYSTTLSALGSSNSIKGKTGTFSLGGTFTGTLQLEAYDGTNWITLPNSVFTTEMFVNFNFEAQTEIRATVSNYVNGTFEIAFS